MSMNLFIFITQNLIEANHEDMTSSYRNAIFTALSKDHPDLQDIIKRAMLSKSPSGPFKVFYSSLIEACQGDNSVKYSAHADFLKKHFPSYTDILNPAFSSNLNIKGFIGIPEFMVVSDIEFFQRKKGINNSAARWVAQALLHFKSKQSNGIVEIKEKQKAYNRLSSLISGLTGKEIADHMTFLYPGWETSDRYGSVVDSQDGDDPLSALVGRLFKDAKENVSKLNDGLFTETVADPELVKDGELERFIQGRAEFKKNLHKKIKKEGEDGAALWLQKPEVQKDVRDLAAQTTLISVVNDFQEKENKNKVFSSYIDAVERLDDFNAVLHSLYREGYGELSKYDFTANLIQKAAALKYSPLDAVTLIEGVFFQNNYSFGDVAGNKNVKDFEHLVVFAKNDNWNAESIDGLWSESHRKINPKIAYWISSVATHGAPQSVWQNLTEKSIASMLEYVSGLDSNAYRSEQKQAHFSQMLKRVPSLSFKNRSKIAVEYITKPLYSSGETHDEQKNIISLAMDGMDDTQRKSVEDSVLAKSASAGALLVLKVDKIFSPEKILSGLVPQFANKSNFPVDPRALMTIVKLCGYDNSNPSNSLNLSSIDDNVKIKTMAGLSAIIASENFNSVLSQMGDVPFRAEMSTRALNILKNIVFDIHESLQVDRGAEGELLSNSACLIKEGFLTKNQRISWEGVCQLLAPFLNEPRPSIDFTKNESVKENSPPKENAVEEFVSKDALQEKIKNWRGGHNHRFGPYGLEAPLGFYSGGMRKKNNDFEEQPLTVESFKYHIAPPLFMTPPLGLVPALFIEPVIAFNVANDLLADKFYLNNDLTKENQLARKSRVLK